MEEQILQQEESSQEILNNSALIIDEPKTEELNEEWALLLLQAREAKEAEALPVAPTEEQIRLQKIFEDNRNAKLATNFISDFIIAKNFSAEKIAEAKTQLEKFNYNIERFEKQIENTILLNEFTEQMKVLRVEPPIPEEQKPVTFSVGYDPITKNVMGYFPSNIEYNEKVKKPEWNYIEISKEEHDEAVMLGTPAQVIDEIFVQEIPVDKSTKEFLLKEHLITLHQINTKHILKFYPDTKQRNIIAQSIASGQTSQELLDMNKFISEKVASYKTIVAKLKDMSAEELQKIDFYKLKNLIENA